MSLNLSTSRVEVVQPKSGRAYAVIEVPSSSNPNKSYRVDVINLRCSCPAWTHARPVGGVRLMCKHLRGLGFNDL